MAGPSDGFFRDVVATVGGELAAKLPDVEKRRTAAKALGQTLTLADVAVKMGLLDEAKRGELAALEGGDEPAPEAVEAAAEPEAAPEPAPSEPAATPSGARRTTKLPSGSPLPSAGGKVPSAARVPAAVQKPPTASRPVARATPAAPVPAPSADPGALTECIQCNNMLTAGSDPKGTGLCATCRGDAESLGEEESDSPRSASRPTKRRPRSGAPAASTAARPAASSATGPLLIMGAVLAAALIVAVAFIVKQQQTPPEPVASPTPAPSAPAPAPSPVAVAPDPTPTPADRTSHKAKLANMAMTAIKLARGGDRTGAKKQLARIRLEATEPEDAEIVKAAEKEVDAALREASGPKATPSPSNLDPDGHRIPPHVDGNDDDPTPAASPAPVGPNPAESSSRGLYRDFRARLDPLFGHFDLDAARALLAQAPALEGSAVQDLEDDKLIPDALDRFLAMAGRGARKAVGSAMDLHLAGGTKIRGKVSDVDGVNITIAGAGGEQLVKVSELTTEDLITFATQGLTKDAQQDYALGRGLVSYYACDLDGARPSLAGTSNPLGKHILERISLEGAPKVGPHGKRPSPGKTPKPEDGPATPDEPGAGAAIPPADLAALQALVTNKVYDEGDGRIGMRYPCSGDNEAGDFDSRGCDVFQVKQTEKPGTYMRPFTDLECGISSNDDIAILHKIPLKGDIEITVEFWVNFMHDSNSGLTFVMGFDKKRWIGAAYGQQLWKCDGKSRPKPASPTPPEVSKFAQSRDCTVKISRKGDTLKVTFNNLECGTTTGASGYDGKWGFLAHNLKIGIKRIDVHGVPILAK